MNIRLDLAHRNLLQLACSFNITFSEDCDDIHCSKTLGLSIVIILIYCLFRSVLCKKEKSTDCVAARLRLPKAHRG
eukprot:TRINITY_DN41_c0_g2_i15.p1 TRINITY_DN41_c0_g2~~TRINITY_DN41_c0_g2_i15.p1  ORF type:complete len:76 (-),score=19.69 TRINITY_DN41_c0_g2_i15:2-229(-)